MASISSVITIIKKVQEGKLTEGTETSASVFISNIVLILTNSMMGQVICYNSNVQTLANLEHLNFTNNRITQIGQDISALSNLKSLDLSDNLLSEALNPLEFSRLPTSLLNLDMTQNVIIINIVLYYYYYYSILRLIIKFI